MASDQKTVEKQQTGEVAKAEEKFDYKEAKEKYQKGVFATSAALNASQALSQK